MKIVKSLVVLVILDYFKPQARQTVRFHYRGTAFRPTDRPEQSCP
jgi:hypothetical protein